MINDSVDLVRYYNYQKIKNLLKTHIIVDLCRILCYNLLIRNEKTSDTKDLKNVSKNKSSIIFIFSK